MKPRHGLALIGVLLIACAPVAALLAVHWVPVAAIGMSAGALCLCAAAILTPGN